MKSNDMSIRIEGDRKRKLLKYVHNWILTIYILTLCLSTVSSEGISYLNSSFYNL